MSLSRLNDDRYVGKSGNSCLASVFCWIVLGSLTIGFVYIKSHGGEVSFNVEYKENPEAAFDASKFVERLGYFSKVETADHKARVFASRPKLVPDPPRTEAMPYSTLYDALSKWHPHTPEIPETFQESLQSFNFGDPYERELAVRYREAEIPFKIHNVSEFDAITRLWSDEYLSKQTKALRSHRVEKSVNNKFLFWSMRQQDQIEDYTPPTEVLSTMDFDTWVKLAHEAEEKKIKPSDPHYYYFINAEKRNLFETFVGRDLKMFSTSTENFFITNVEAMRSINCRFGMRGIIGEAHYDLGKNMIALIRGNKRYILSPPKECPNLAIVTERKHPSVRQSVIDFSDLEQAKSRGFEKVAAIDTVVHEGEVLYIPSYWFHYVVSLDYTIQCNARSGVPKSLAGKKEIDKCFGYETGGAGPPPPGQRMMG